jgi:hypothetical protein
LLGSQACLARRENAMFCTCIWLASSPASFDTAAKSFD